MAKKMLAVFVFGFFLVLGAEATMVSFVVIETGLTQDDGINQRSVQWENALLDAFFDAGYIVSNVPMVRFDSKPSGRLEDLVSRDIVAARAGGAEFLIVAQLDYAPGSLSPNDISLVLFSIIPPSSRIHENQVSGKTYRSEREEMEDLKSIVGEFVPHLRERR